MVLLLPRCWALPVPSWVFLGNVIGFGTLDGLSFGSIATATVGAFILLFAYNQLK